MESKEILVEVSTHTEVDSQNNTEYDHYVQFPHTNWRYTIRATKEGFMYAVIIWKEAGYKITRENKYPK